MARQQGRGSEPRLLMYLYSSTHLQVHMHLERYRDVCGMLNVEHLKATTGCEMDKWEKDYLCHTLPLIQNKIIWISEFLFDKLNI